RGGLLAGHLAARGGAARAHPDLRHRHQPRIAAPGAGRGLRRRSVLEVQRELSGGRGQGLAVRLLHGALRVGPARPAPQEGHPVLGSQPGHRQRVRRGAAGLVPERPHLLRPAAARAGRRAAARGAVPARVPGAGQQGDAAVLAACTGLSRGGARAPHLSEAMSGGMHQVDAIVIGGSSGALEALAVLLPALPADTRVAVAIVIHVPATRPSHLPQVMAARTALPVREADDKEPVVPGVVYVAPPNYHLLIERGGTFALSADEALHFSRPAIDV